MYCLNNFCKFTCIIILNFLINVTKVTPQIQTRIVGGRQVDVGDIPYIVSLRAFNIHGCGGTIIDEKHVLTAAHCVYNWTNRPQYFSIQYGTVKIDPEGLNIIQVKSINVHEKYDHNSPGYLYDIAVLELTDKIQFDPNVMPVSLPDVFEEPGDMSIAGVAGWGLPYSGGSAVKHLQSVLIQIFSDEYCYSLDNRYVPNVHICGGILGGGHGQCTGDSGGPLIVDGKLFGIVSWSEKPCASPGKPGFFTRVPTFRLWIYKRAGI